MCIKSINCIKKSIKTPPFCLFMLMQWACMVSMEMLLNGAVHMCTRSVFFMFSNKKCILRQNHGELKLFKCNKVILQNGGKFKKVG